MTLLLTKPTKPSLVLPESFKLDTENHSLLELVLKFVYCDTLPHSVPPKDRTMSLQEETQMKFSIDWWYRAIQKQKERRIIRFRIFAGDEIKHPDEVELCLMRFSSIIVKKEKKDKFLMRRINNYREKHIDYRKAYNLPGSHTKEDYEQGALAIKKFNEDNPDLV